MQAVLPEDVIEYPEVLLHVTIFHKMLNPDPPDAVARRSFKVNPAGIDTSAVPFFFTKATMTITSPAATPAGEAIERV